MLTVYVGLYLTYEELKQPLLEDYNLVNWLYLTYEELKLF